LSIVPQNICVLKDEFLEISSMNSFTEVYAKLRATGIENPIEFFFQYFAYYKNSAPEGFLIKTLFAKIPCELMYSQEDWDRRAVSRNLPNTVGKFNPEIARIIILIATFAYLN
jgi:hypothetical protein